MQPRHLVYAERRAPRYTSYPTAPHFDRSVEAAVYRGWLSAVPADARLSLYLHIPYCRAICLYCGCHTYAARREDVLNRCVDALRGEIELVASALPADEVDSIRWGGGTPNILSPDMFRKLMRTLAFWFDLDRLREHVVEIDPRHLSAEQAALYGAVGVTRASLGVQAFSATVQWAIGRVQPRETIAEAVRSLRKAGVLWIGMDLMYGLPHQTIADVRTSAVLAAALGADSIAMFGYAHVPWMKPRQRLIDEKALPGALERIEQEAAAREELLALGYEAVGLDHYARPDDPLAVAARSGALRRNFQGYVDHDAAFLIGFGASAISTLPQGYAQNAVEVGAWRRAIAAGHLATIRGRALTEDDRRRGKLIEALLCQLSVDLARFGGRDAFAAEMDALAPLMRDGLAALKGEKLVIPDQAWPFARVVAEVFDAYRGDGAARHARAV